MQKLKNIVHVAVPTAFYSDEKLDTHSTLAHVKYLYQHGIKSVLICGSTGEQHSLTLIEKIELIESIEESHLPKDMEIIFGVSSIRQKEAIELASVIKEKSSIHGILLGFPPYIRPTQSEAIIYAESILKEVPNKQIIIYNNPARTGFDLSEQNIIYLINTFQNIIGIKECGDLSRATRIIHKLSREVHFYIGGDKSICNGLKNGFTRLSSIAGNIYPEQISNYFIDKLNKENTEKYNSFIQEFEMIFTDSTISKIKEKISIIENIDMKTSRSPIGK